MVTTQLTPKTVILPQKPPQRGLGGFDYKNQHWKQIRFATKFELNSSLKNLGLHEQQKFTELRKNILFIFKRVWYRGTAKFCKIKERKFF